MRFTYGRPVMRKIDHRIPRGNESVCVFFIVISTASQIINLNLLYHTLGLHKKNNTLGYVCFGFAAAVVVVVIFVVLRYFIAESLLNRARKK